MAGSSLDILIIGGSGFVSGSLVRRAVTQGHQVWVVTRGNLPLPEGCEAITADRKDHDAFKKAVADAGKRWDLVVDCIGYDPEDAEQDIAVFEELATQFVFVSTDFVYQPEKRSFPQDERSGHYLSDDSYGGKKRRCEELLLEVDSSDFAWTVVRPCHIYGPGSLLGCLPLHGRDAELIAKMRRGEPLSLVGGGRFLQQPIFAGDLCDLILSVYGNAHAHGEIFNVAGPDIIESRKYYEIIADVLGVACPEVVEVGIGDFLRENPGKASFICHRIYDVSRLKRAGLQVPAMPIAEGLEAHVEALL